MPVIRKPLQSPRYKVHTNYHNAQFGMTIMVILYEFHAFDFAVYHSTNPVD